MKVPQEISEKFRTANAYEQLRDILIHLPFCFNKTKKLSKEIYNLRGDGWQMIYDIYPELKGKKLKINSEENEVEILPN